MIDSLKTDVPLVDALEKLGGRISFHMPGHKGSQDALTLHAYMDATELNVTDDLYRASGAIDKAQRMMARSAHAAHTIFLTNGSTCGVESMLGYAACPGERVILPRASHLSAVSACALYGIEPIWVDAWADDAGAPHTHEEDVLRAIALNPDARAVLMTRPDYFGRMIPLSNIARAAHEKGMLLLIDEAHGAHLNWMDGGTCVYRPDGSPGCACASALSQGADICVQSAHKTLPALTGGAYLIMRRGIDKDKLLSRVALTQSSSPSFLIMASLDSARAYMDAHGKAELTRVAGECERIYGMCKSLDMRPAREYFDTDCDRTRLALDVTARGITGFEAQQALTDCGVDIEMADEYRIVMICSPMDDYGRFTILRDALKQLPHGTKTLFRRAQTRVPRGRREIGIRQAALGQTERMPLEEAKGRIAARALGAYPPGVAACVPGEVITPEISEWLIREKRAGAELFGLERGMCVVACI